LAEIENEGPNIDSEEQMSKDDDLMARVNKGIALPVPSHYTHSLVRLAVRPQRIAFIINTNLTEDKLLEIVEYNTSIWGGFYNLMVPSSSDHISPGYSLALVKYSPDRIIFCGEFGENFRKSIIEGLEPFGAYHLDCDDKTLDSVAGGICPLKTSCLLEREVLALKHDSASSIRIAKINSDHELKFFALAQLGNYREEAGRFVRERLKAKEVPFPSDQTFREYLTSLAEGLRMVYPVHLSEYHIKLTTTISLPLDAVVVLSNEGTLVEAFCGFWNWRMDVGSRLMPSHDSYLFLPIDLFRRNGNVKSLADWCAERHKHGRMMLVSSSSLQHRVMTLKGKLEELLQDKFRSIEIYHDASRMVVNKMFERELTEEVDWKDNWTRIRVPTPSFDCSSMSSRNIWIVECEIGDRESGKANFFPPRFSSQMELLNKACNRGHEVWSIKGDRWRPSNGKLVFQADMSTDYVDLCIPDNESVFGKVFAKAGYLMRRTEKCDYVLASMKMLESAGLVHLMRDPDYQSLIEGLSLKDGSSYTQRNVVQTLKSHSDEKKKELSATLLSLVRSGFLQRGIVCRCPVCGIKNWLFLKDIEEIVKCSGCQADYQIPHEYEHSYRLSSLVAMCFRQGGLPVILTDHVLQNLARQSYMTLPGVEVSKGGEEGVGDSVMQDVDIIACIDGHIVTVECKTLREMQNEECIKTIVEQLERDYSLACKIGAAIFFVATMGESAIKSIEKFAEGKNRKGDQPFVVNLIHNELTRGRLVNKPYSEDQVERNELGPVYIDQLLQILNKNLRTKSGSTKH